MSRTIRFAAVVLIISTLACGSLQAMPFAVRASPADAGLGAPWAVIAKWLASFLTPERPPRETPPAPAQPKEGSIMDPDGHH